MALVMAIFCARTALAAGAESCGVSSADTASTQAPQTTSFTPYRLGTYKTDLAARDVELLWDGLYGAIDLNTLATLGNFVRALVQTTGTNPTATNATNLQAVYNTLRRQGSDWNPSNPADSLSYRVGRSGDADSYTNADRAHSDVYLFHPSRKQSGDPDGKWPSDYQSDNEDYSTGHSGSDVRGRNAVMYIGPQPGAAIDLAGTGWTSPSGPWRLNVSHEIAHSFPPGDGDSGPLTELWSAAAEAINGIPAIAPGGEVPYTWSLLAPDGGDVLSPVRKSSSNYAARTSFMAYVAYNFLNGNPNRTLAGSTDDLLTRWAKTGGTGNRGLDTLVPLLSNSECSTCAGRSDFHDGVVPLSNVDRLNALLHAWRVANFVNSPSLANGQFGYPAWSNFSPASNQRAWQSFNGDPTDDIVALPATLNIGPQQLTRDLAVSGSRSFRGSTYPLAITALGSNYWVLRADPTIQNVNRELVVRIIPDSGSRCGNVTVRLLASAATYNLADATGEESILWQHPESATSVTPIASTVVDSSTTPIEVVIPNFGLTNKAAVLVLSTGAGPDGLLLSSPKLPYRESVPYRLEVGFRTTPYQAPNPVSVSNRPELPEGMPTWSPTGDELAYYSVDASQYTQPQIFRRKLDGSAPTRVAAQTKMQLAPDWSPRGDKIAFEAQEVGQLSSTIWIAELGGVGTTALRQLTTASGCASMPVFQPNGRGLAYTYIPDPSSSSPQCYLRWIGSDGQGDGQVARIGGPGNFRRKPRWSADGKWLYFSVVEQGDRLMAFPFKADTGFSGIAVPKVPTPLTSFDLHPGSGKLVLETPSAIVNTGLGSECVSPGSNVATSRVATFDTLNVGAGLTVRVSDSRLFARQPSYSPDGVRIAYQLERRGNADGSIEARQINWNHAPHFTAGVADQALTAAVPFQVTLQATDPDGEVVTFRGDYMPPGSTLYAGNTFRWLNPIAGEYDVVLRALDGSGGVDKRVVHFSVAADGGGGDPFHEGDGGCTACAMSPAGTASLMAGETTEAGVGNSHLNGALPGAYFTSLSRATRPVVDATGTISVTMDASLPGTVSLDAAKLVVVDHDPTQQAVTTTQGIRVGTLSAPASMLDGMGRDFAAPLNAAQLGNTHVTVPSGSSLEVKWPDAADGDVLVLDCAHTGIGWGEASGVELLSADTGESAPFARLSPRSDFDLLGAPTPVGGGIRLVFLADARVRGIYVMRAASAPTNAQSLVPSASSWPDGVQAVATTDATHLDLAKGESIRLDFTGPAPGVVLARSYFLSFRAAYTPPTGAWSARAQRVDSTPSPTSFALQQSQPNPFGRTTQIHFDISRRTLVRLEIFDAQGRRTRTLVNRTLEPGRFTESWDGRDEAGNRVSPGVYMYTLSAGEFRAQKRVVLLPQ